MNKKLLFFFVFCVYFFFSLEKGFAQCAMCRRVTETNVETNENKVGRSLNAGVLYLLSIPYLIGSVCTIVWIKNRKKA